METVRTMSKSEVAMKYLPHLTPHSAVNRLMAWITNEPRLTLQLSALGYNKRQKYFTKEQVEAIFYWLGNP